jgi:hypothetical protein
MNDSAANDNRMTRSEQIARFALRSFSEAGIARFNYLYNIPFKTVINGNEIHL